MKIFKVGGCVRDTLLGLEPKDIDYVVVGATPAQMLAMGYEQVGASFPVFLKDGEEYALARTERKNGVGYHGFEVTFDPTVTLEDDLIRRDLTINAMAMDMETGEVIDPYGGRHDLAQGILRHTSEAFAEDPVRVLRTARFAARYGFKIANDTVELMKKVAPELAHVPQERIWAEFEKGLGEERPALMMEALERCDALWVPALQPYRKWAFEMQIKGRLPLHVRFVMLARGFTDSDYVTCKIPTDLARISKAFNKHYDALWNYPFMTKTERLTFLMEFRALTDMKMLVDVLEAARAWLDFKSWDDTVANINHDIAKAKTVDAKAVAEANPTRVKDAIFEARLHAITQ